MTLGDSYGSDSFVNAYTSTGNVGSGLISALGSVVSSGINAWSQNSINNSNIDYNNEINYATLANNTEINDANIAANEKINQDNIAATTSENQLNRAHDVDMANLSYSLNEQAAVNDYQRSMDAWNAENAYNDPSAQRDRLEAAGINPAVAFSSGVGTTSGNSNQMADSSSGGASVSSTPGQVPTLRAAFRQATKFNSIMQVAPYLDPQAFLAVSEAGLINAQKRKIEKETGAIDFTTRLQDAQTQLFQTSNLTEQQKEMALSLQNSLSSITLGMQQENLHLSNEKLKSEITTAEKNWEKIASEIDKNDAWISLTAGQLAVQKVLARSTVNLNEAQIEQYNAIAANLYQLNLLNEEKTKTQQHLTSSAKSSSEIHAYQSDNKESIHSTYLGRVLDATCQMLGGILGVKIGF